MSQGKSEIIPSQLGRDNSIHFIIAPNSLSSCLRRERKSPFIEKELQEHRLERILGTSGMD
jgi:hypothetical protein